MLAQADATMDATLFLITGIIFGVSAGLSPGPLLTLVISNTIKYGKIEGIKVAIAPLITDIPIVAIIIALFSLISTRIINNLLGTISIGGALFIAYLAYESFKTNHIELKNIEKTKPQSLKEGMLINLLNPHPYIFYLSVGAPLIIRGLTDLGIIGPVAFMIGLLGSLVGAKIIIATIVSKSKDFLKNNTYIYIMKLLGIALLIYAIIFLQNGIQLLKA